MFENHQEGVRSASFGVSESVNVASPVAMRTSSSSTAVSASRPGAAVFAVGDEGVDLAQLGDPAEMDAAELAAVRVCLLSGATLDRTDPAVVGTLWRRRRSASRCCGN